MDQDRPKIDFDSTQYRFQVPTGNLGSEDDVKSDLLELAYGIGGDRERGLNRPLLNGLSKMEQEADRRRAEGVGRR